MPVVLFVKWIEMSLCLAFYVLDQHSATLWYFEGLITDEAFLNGWWAIRKIKGRSKPKKADSTTAATPTDGQK